jgi:hypothetical protein
LPWYNADIESNGEKKMKKYFGSDDGYDYSRDNRDGYVQEFLKSLERDEEMRRMQEKVKNEKEKS